MLKKRVIASLLALIIPLTSLANVQTSMQSWFNDIGAYGNVTGPAAYQGQTMNLYSGGSLYMRTPVKNYQLVTISPPGFKAGCGGIDLFAGSFSFINKEQLTALLRNIANNAIGYAFMMAVKSISPDLADLMQYLQDQISKVNNLNINSCQAAEGMVAAIGSTLTDKTQEKEGKVAGASLNLYADVFESWDAWKDRAKAKQTRQAAISADTRNKDTFDPGNVVWRALSRVNGVDDETRQLMMSMTGTIIIVPPGEDESGSSTDQKAKWLYKPGAKITFRQFVGDGSSATATLSGLICDEYADCKNPTYTENGITSGSFAKYVRDKIVTMKQKVESRDAGGQGTIDVSLISASSLPVWKMLSLAANMPGGEFVVENHTQLVAVDVAHSYFTNLAKTLREAVQNEMGKGNADVAEAAKSILSRVTEIEQEGREMLVAEYQKGVQVAQMQRSIQWLDQSLKAGLPTNVFQSMMAFNR
ncbi:MAG: conjugal transfer protein TraH [Rhodocyclaceae bacterium]|nr:conjugal transfer protein TraH [Rhodocyclaceae bacterium]